MYHPECDLSEMNGKTIANICGFENDDITFTCTDGSEFRMWHQQDCCENVRIEDICGDLKSLIGQTIVDAYEDSSQPDPERDPDDYVAESETWTFYVIRTLRNTITIRWYGSSNGYYSESVSFAKIK